MSTDTLFEQHSIKEIQDIEKKLRNDIERKKEELRQMVGERYRDLMEAADTITEMKYTAENITSCIKNMEVNCAKFEQSSIKSGIMHSVKNKVTQRKRKNERLYFMAAMIKILMDSPGKIWAYIEQENYLNAFLLYTLARHTHTLLVVDSMYNGQGILNNFPIINKQWASTRPFRNILLQKSREVLLTDRICAEKVVGPLCCILLTSEISLEQMLDEILEKRKVVISNVFRPERPAKTQVSDLIDALQNALEIVHAIFYSNVGDSKVNLLEQTIITITSTESPGPINLINSDSLTFQYLPEDVTGYRPMLQSEFCNLHVDYLQQVCNVWISSMKDELKEKLTDLLNYVSTMKGLALIREAVVAQQQKESCIDLVYECLFGKPFSIWEFFLKDVFMQRIKDIINSKISQSISECIDAVDDLHKKETGKEDISSYIWMESETDLAPNIGWSTQHQRQVWEGGTLGMKAYALTPSVQTMCLKIDKALEGLLQDVSHFNPDDTSQNERWIKAEHLGCDKELLDPYMDLGSIFAHLTNECQRNFTNLCDYFKKVLVSYEQSKDSIVLSKLVSLGHLCHGLTQLCPHLLHCLLLSKTYNNSTRQSPGYLSSGKDEQIWMSLKTTFLELSCLSFRIWSKHKIKALIEVLDCQLMACSATRILQSLLQWDSIEIQEESEEGETIKSVLKIPQQISVPLYNCLFMFCWELNQIGCFSLSSDVRLEIQDQYLNQLLAVYQKKVHEQWPEDIFTPHLAQTQSLQYLFDVQFLLGLMGSGNKDADQSALSKNIIAEIVRYIDPFDMDVFAPHIQTNLRKAIQRSMLLLGLTTSAEQMSHFHNLKSLPTSGPIDHHLMLMPSAIPRLPLLPYATRSMPMGSRNDSTKNVSALSQVPLPLKTSPSHSSSPNLSTSDNLTSMLKSSSFYDRVTAMSSSWFGGS